MQVCQRALAAMESILVHSHADSSTARLVGAVLAGPSDLAASVNLVELQHGQLGVLVDVVGLLGLGVGLLLPLLATTAQTQHQVERRLLLDVVVGQGAAVLELLAREYQTLLIRGNALLVLDLCLDVIDGIRGLHIEGDGLARERLNEDLHSSLS